MERRVTSPPCDSSWPYYDDSSLNQLMFASYISRHWIEGAHDKSKVVREEGKKEDSTPPEFAPSSAPSPIPSSSLALTLHIHEGDSDGRANKGHKMVGSEEEEGRKSRSFANPLPPSSSTVTAPGYSLLTKITSNAKAATQLSFDDAIGDWEMVSESSNDELASTGTKGTKSEVSNLKGDSKRRNSFLEKRASSQMEEVEALGRNVLGDEVFEVSGFSMPSLQRQSDSKGNHASSSSSSSSKTRDSTKPMSTREMMEREADQNPLFLRCFRAVEIMISEAKYLFGLEHVLRHVLGPLQEKMGVEGAVTNLLHSTDISIANTSGNLVPSISPDELKTIFCNLESLYVTNCSLLGHLISIFRTWDASTSTLGQLFVYYAPLLKVSYSVYLSDLSNALAQINILSKKDAKFRDFLTHFSSLPLSDKRPLSDFISTPLQRITRYEILLIALRKETPQGHADAILLDKAISTVHNTLTRINASPLEVERRAKLLELQERFAPGQTIMDSARLLLLEQEDMLFRSISDSTFSTQPVFLFTDSLLTATTSYSGYLYKQHLFDLHSVVIMDRPSEAPELPSLWLLYPLQTYILAFPSSERKNVWMNAIAQAISILVSKSPERERTRHQYAIHLLDNNIPIQIPVEAQNDPNHPAWKLLLPLQPNPPGFFASIRSWFTGNAYNSNL